MDLLWSALAFQGFLGATIDDLKELIAQFSQKLSYAVEWRADHWGFSRHLGPDVDSTSSSVDLLATFAKIYPAWLALDPQKPPEATIQTFLVESLA